MRLTAESKIALKPLSLTHGLLAGAILLNGLGLGPWAGPAAPGVVGRVPVAVSGQAGLRVVASSATDMLVELTVGAFTTETVTLNGQVFQRLTLPDFGQSTLAGAPQVPQRSALLGIPSLAGVQVELASLETQTVDGLRLAPAPTVSAPAEAMDTGAATQAASESLAPDPAAYAVNAFYPGREVQLGQVGDWRDQPVAEIQFNPVQYNPVTGQTRIAHRLLARLSWTASAAPAAGAGPRAAAPEFEAVLRTSLLNYASLARPAPATPPATDQGVGATLAATSTISPALKINITATGIYTLSFAAISAAGFSLTGVNPQTLKLMHLGSEVPIQVVGNAIVFYATAYEDVYTNVNVYWLEAGSGNGLRMTPLSSAPAGAPVPIDFPAHLHAEINQNYWANMPNGAGQDHWFWGTRLSPDNGGLATFRDYSDTMAYPPLGCGCLTLHNLSTTALTATVSVLLRGYTANTHHTQVKLNGTLIADQFWGGQGQISLGGVVSHSLLVNGSNVVHVNTVMVTPSDVAEQILVDAIDIDYRGRFVAASNALSFTAPAAGPWKFNVTGFAAPNVQVFDITNSEAPRPISLAAITGSGPYTVTVPVTASAGSRYLALTPDQFKSPAALKLDAPSNWQSANQGADWIIITHRDFYTEAVSLANLRQSQGLRVAVVDVQDLYDEFNNGLFNPQAIRDFLAYAYAHWQAPAPTYVVLLGDACQDFKNALWDNPAAACPNQFVPAPIYESNLSGQVPSDDWYVDFQGNDLLPDMLIGRISVQTEQQAHDAITKIIQYDQNPPQGAWRNTVTLAAGGDDPIFGQVSDQISNTIPAPYQVNRLYLANFGDPHAAVVSALDQGSLLVDYLGHGEYFRWGTYNGSTVYLHKNDIAGLTNANKLAVLTIGDCLNGAFSSTASDPSMAEVFQRTPASGAVAVFAPSDVGFPTGHRILMLALYQAIFVDHLTGLGAAVAAAKVNVLGQSSGWAGLVQTYILFGDPATRLAAAAAAPGGHLVYLPLASR